MVKKKVSKQEAKKRVEEFFSVIETKDSKDVKKIKRLVMSANIPLKEKRKEFCPKCLKPYKSPKIRIKDGMKVVECDKCGNTSRWKLKRLGDGQRMLD
jgi:RNase P subunit RPR2